MEPEWQLPAKMRQVLEVQVFLVDVAMILKSFLVNNREFVTAKTHSCDIIEWHCVQPKHENTLELLRGRARA